jgi:hypothetical protein
LNEADIRQEVQRMLRAIGWNDYHPPDITFKGAPVGGVSMGRPDIYLFNSVDVSAVCEVKTFVKVKKIEPYFNPEHISNKQRRWLDWWVYGRNGIGMLAIGSLDRPRRLFIVPWEDYVIDEFFQRNREARENDVDINTLNDFIGLPKKMPISIFENNVYECDWTKEGWILKSTHPLNRFKTIPHSENQWKNVSLRMEE